MTKQPLTIDFVSDVVCPWCIIGLNALEAALVELDGEVAADIRFQPFELNPAMPPEGQNIAEHIAEKYGATPEQSAANREGIRARAAEHGFTMNFAPDARIYNTFDAHRLLHWAEGEGKQAALKHALFTAYFTDGQNVSDARVLAGVAASVGLDAAQASAILSSDLYAAEVRAEEGHWRQQGINAVPTVIINNRYIISGGQPAEKFAKALRSIAAEAQQAAIAGGTAAHA